MEKTVIERAEAWAPAQVTLAGHAHLDLAWSWRPREARAEVLDTARSAVEILEDHASATFVMSQAVTYRWLSEDDPDLFSRMRWLVEAGRWEPVGGWWVEADLFGASPESLARQAVLGQRTFEHLVGRRCSVGFSPDTFGHPDWLPGLLAEAGMSTYVITRPSADESGLPPLFVWKGRDGAKVLVARLSQYEGPPVLDPAGLCLYGVGNHGGGPTREHLSEADGLCSEGTARHGSLASWAAGIDVSNLPVVRGDLVHHARGCYASMTSFKERMRRLEHRYVQLGSSIEDWEPLLFWQFHDVLAGTCVPDVYEEAEADLAALERKLWSPLPSRGPARTIVPRHRVDEGRPAIARETLGQPWCGWVEVAWTASRPASGIAVEDHESFLLHVEQHGTAWRLRSLVHLDLEPNEERELAWELVPGKGPVRPFPPSGVRFAVLDDPTDTWGHSLVSYGAEVDPTSATRLRCAGGPDGLVEVWGEWYERDRALKLVVPRALLPEDRRGRLEKTAGEMPGGEWEGPVWGRVWSYDVVGGAGEELLRITIRRSPPYALHDPLRRVDGIEFAYTDQGGFRASYWLRSQPSRPPPLLFTH
jgi:Glycosyl hydrolases family 38 N-terminal domain/Alpha mannosidase middle domain